MAQNWLCMAICLSFLVQSPLRVEGVSNGHGGTATQLGETILAKHHNEALARDGKATVMRQTKIRRAHQHLQSRLLRRQSILGMASAIDAAVPSITTGPTESRGSKTNSFGGDASLLANGASLKKPQSHTWRPHLEIFFPPNEGKQGTNSINSIEVQFPDAANSVGVTIRNGRDEGCEITDVQTGSYAFLVGMQRNMYVTRISDQDVSRWECGNVLSLWVRTMRKQSSYRVVLAPWAALEDIRKVRLSTCDKILTVMFVCITILLFVPLMCLLPGRLAMTLRTRGAATLNEQPPGSENNNTGSNAGESNGKSSQDAVEGIDHFPGVYPARLATFLRHKVYLSGSICLAVVGIVILSKDEFALVTKYGRPISVKDVARCLTCATEISLPKWSALALVGTKENELLKAGTPLPSGSLAKMQYGAYVVAVGCSCLMPGYGLLAVFNYYLEEEITDDDTTYHWLPNGFVSYLIYFVFGFVEGSVLAAISFEIILRLHFASSVASALVVQIIEKLKGEPPPEWDPLVEEDCKRILTDVVPALSAMAQYCVAFALALMVVCLEILLMDTLGLFSLGDNSYDRVHFITSLLQFVLCSGPALAILLAPARVSHMCDVLVKSLVRYRCRSVDDDRVVRYVDNLLLLLNAENDGEGMSVMTCGMPLNRAGVISFIVRSTVIFGVLSQLFSLLFAANAGVTEALQALNEFDISEVALRAELDPWQPPANISWSGTHGLVRDVKDFPHARSSCYRAGAELVSINSETENDKVKEVCGQNSCWIGLQDPLTWMDGSEVKYSKWSRDETVMDNTLDAFNAITGTTFAFMNVVIPQYDLLFPANGEWHWGPSQLAIKAVCEKKGNAKTKKRSDRRHA